MKIIIWIIYGMHMDPVLLGRRPTNKYTPSYSITISYFIAETRQASCICRFTSTVYAIQW